MTTLSGGTGYADGLVKSAKLQFPLGIATDGGGKVYIADRNNNAVRVLSGGVVSTLVGGPTKSGYLDGPAAQALFNHVTGVAVDGAGVVHIVDQDNNRIRIYTP